MIFLSISFVKFQSEHLRQMSFLSTLNSARVAQVATVDCSASALCHESRHLSFLVCQRTIFHPPKKHEKKNHYITLKQTSNRGRTGGESSIFNHTHPPFTLTQTEE